ncbi:MAG: hypothetical protein KDB03_01555 [Planctomycetales bacterium]|nr:hypothetical protein [Planctomycetales bacterium]
MSLRYFSTLPLLLAAVGTSGCQATRITGRKVGQAAVVIPIFVAETIINSVLDSNETMLEQEQREIKEQQWKQHWRANPNENPAMYEAFKDDYK